MLEGARALARGDESSLELPALPPGKLSQVSAGNILSRAHEWNFRSIGRPTWTFLCDDCKPWGVTDCKSNHQGISRITPFSRVHEPWILRHESREVPHLRFIELEKHAFVVAAPFVYSFVSHA